MKIASLIRDNLALLICPSCQGELAVVGEEAIGCTACSRQYFLDEGIPRLVLPAACGAASGDVTSVVKAFYEENPFPNYDDIDSPSTLREKARRGSYLARMLDVQIPGDAWILDAGCGTGQLTNFLGMTGQRRIFGADLGVNCLKLGERFRRAHGIHNVGFLQMSLFQPVFPPESFDVVICSGVLHHTSDPFGGFKRIAELVKPGGFVLVGLYNRYGRILTDVRRVLLRISGDRFKFLDARLRDPSISEKKKRVWLKDQYKHPHESKHSIGEVQEWLERCGFEFTRSIPDARAFAGVASEENLFASHPKGNKLDHALIQTKMVLSPLYQYE